MMISTAKKFLIRKLGIGDISCERLRAAGAKVGENVHIFTKKIDLNHAFLLQIGNNVTISDARILLHDASTKLALGFSRVGRVVIGDNVFIGADAIILPNVSIGSNVIIGAGTIVSKDIPDNSVCIGAPCRVIEAYSDYIERMRFELNKKGAYTTPYSLKSKSEIEQMQNNLSGGGIGFDM